MGYQGLVAQFLTFLLKDTAECLHLSRELVLGSLHIAVSYSGWYSECFPLLLSLAPVALGCAQDTECLILSQA